MKSYKRSLFWKCKSALLTAALASVVVAVGQVGADEVKNLVRQLTIWLKQVQIRPSKLRLAN